MTATRQASALDRVAATLEEALSSLWRRRPFVAATVAAIAVTLSFPAAIVLGLSRAADAVDSVRAGGRLRVFLAPDATEAQVAAIRAALEGHEGIAGAEVIGPAQARAAFLESFPDLAPAVKDLGPEELALPASVEAWGPGSPLVIEALARDLRRFPGVSDVRHDAQAAERLETLAGRLRAGAMGAAALALLATAFGIGSVIRMGALARREQLAVMRLVGAPRHHLRVPFIVEGLVQGALGGLVAGGLLAVAAAVLAPVASAFGPDALRLAPAGWMWLVGGPAIAGALSAWLSVEAVLRRHAQLER